MLTGFWRRIPLQFKVWLGRFIALIVLHLISCGLNMMGYRRLCRLLMATSPAPNTKQVSLGRARMIARVVNRVAKSRYARMNCIRRSLALWWILRWVRLDSQVQIGINLDEGHAWVEHGGAVVNDRPETRSRYTVLYLNDLSPEVVSKLL
jgi:hypothetical protein